MSGLHCKKTPQMWGCMLFHTSILSRTVFTKKKTNQKSTESIYKVLCISSCVCTSKRQSAPRKSEQGIKLTSQRSAVNVCYCFCNKSLSPKLWLRIGEKPRFCQLPFSVDDSLNTLIKTHLIVPFKHMVNSCHMSTVKFLHRSFLIRDPLVIYQKYC